MQAAVKLRGVLPVVVDADLWEDAGEALDDIFIPDAEIWYSRTPSCMVMVVPHADICPRIVHIPAAWAVSVCMPCLSDDGRQHALVGTKVRCRFSLWPESTAGLPRRLPGILFVSVIGEEVGQAMILQTPELWLLRTSVHRDTIYWM